jgi:phosphoesterase RecJ-like protein
VNGYPYPVPEDLLKRIHSSERIWLSTHERPDADGYGSLLACGLTLRELGKEVGVMVDDEVPAHFDALPGHDDLPRVQDASPDPDLLLLFDCHRLHRVGDAISRLATGIPVAVVDHHPLDERGCEAEVCWVEPSAAATAVVALSLLRELDGETLGQAQATCLYAALVTDTGGFRYESTGADTFRAAADLVAAGADAAAITETFLHRRSPNALKLLGEVFESVQYHADGRVAVAEISADLLARHATSPSETEGIISHLRSVEGVRLVALGVEAPGGHWRVSLRAKSPHRVNQVARRFGGGGHAAAAAFTAEGSWDALCSPLLDALFEELRSNGSRP